MTYSYVWHSNDDGDGPEPCVINQTHERSYLVVMDEGGSVQVVNDYGLPVDEPGVKLFGYCHEMALGDACPDHEIAKCRQPSHGSKATTT